MNKVDHRLSSNQQCHVASKKPNLRLSKEHVKLRVFPF